jgi:hypothetical protein
MTHRIASLALGALVAAGAISPAFAAEPLVRLNAVAVDTNGRPHTERVSVVINRWTTDDEKAALLDTLVKKGGDQLYTALQDTQTPAGYIQADGRLGWRIQYARETKLPDGTRRIVFVTDRPLGFREAGNGTRSSFYNFMMGEVRIGADGKGVGSLMPAAKISFDDPEKKIEIENFASLPVRLADVTAQG